MPEDFEKEMDSVSISFRLNGEAVSIQVDPSESALVVLRDRLGLKGTKEGCGIGECGACSIMVDGKVINSCLTFAPQLDGREVITVEGLAALPAGQSIQKAFAEAGGVQCGFCTPGMLISSFSLLLSNPKPARSEIIEAISGNICRCTGYVQIIDAIESASRTLSDNDNKNL